MFWDFLNNHALICGLIAWLIAGFLKIPLEFMETRRWNWGLWLSTGGMPSSHSSLLCGTTMAIGLYEGFGTSSFAIAFAISMVVVYDAAGVRRQAGIHAEKINLLITEFFQGEPISQEQLKEVLGHTPLEVIGGIFLGILTSIGIWLFWR